MTVILASRPNVYSSSPLDRIGTRREDAAWIEQRLHDPDTLFVPVWRNRNLVRGIDDIDVTLEYRDAIESFEAKRRAAMPWLPTAQRE